MPYMRCCAALERWLRGPYLQIVLTDRFCIFFFIQNRELQYANTGAVAAGIFFLIFRQCRYIKFVKQFNKITGAAIY
jgi:hypothetical protein